MSDKQVKAPIGEQNICVACGFCCDGTLFLHACLLPGERGHLPEEIEKKTFTEGDNDYFRLPCNYFSEKCIIYDKARAEVCSAYRCQLLRDFADKKLSKGEAQDIVREAMMMRDSLIEKYRRLSGSDEPINFMQLLQELGRMQKQATNDKPLNTDYEILQAECNIFEALLIKHVRSAGDFEKMMITKG